MLQQFNYTFYVAHVIHDALTNTFNPIHNINALLH
jgi:hypothetical protein